MKPAGLLHKYIVIAVVICTLTVAAVTGALYLLFHSSLEASLAQGTPAFHQLAREEAYVHARNILILSAAMTFTGIALAMAVIMIFVTRQVRAIRFLTRSTEQLARGAWDEPIRLQRTDELGQLAQGFDQLRENLRATTISRDYLDKVLASMSEALLIADPRGCITRANAAAGRLLETAEEKLPGRSVLDFVTPAQRKALRLEDTGARSLETVFLSAAGNEIPVSYTVSMMPDGDPAQHGFIITARNIAERKIAEQRIRYLARIDALTKVPNRMQFQHLLQRAIARAGRRGSRLALLYLDIDRFKDINDIYGHAGGDLCLETLTERLRRRLPETTVIGRFAGDEFGIILDNADWFSEPESLLLHEARELLHAIAAGVPFHGQQIHMTASIGIAVFPTDANNAIDLLRNADAALYHAKHAGGNTIEFFDPAMSASVAERLMLKSRLRQAYERNELLLRYQPKVNLRTGRVVGAEALVRWDLAEHGIIMPSEFIPLAEESNLILDIGEWVLDRVCHDFQDWQTQMLFPGKVSLNLSLKQLRQPDFSQRVAAIFRRYGIPPASLELEITESTLMENPERTVNILDELYNMGLSLAIDDFGTGYSSLSALQKFPISTLKIDQSFVHRIASDADDATIVTTIIQMGHGLNLDVIAEGVESEQQLAFLRTANCDYVQGMLFGAPMSADDFMQLLMSQRQGTAAFGMFFE